MRTSLLFLAIFGVVSGCGGNSPSTDDDSSDTGGSGNGQGDDGSGAGGENGGGTGGGNGGTGGQSEGGAGGDDGGDVDPCDTDNGGCDELTSCTEDAGDAVCGDCPSGYLGDGLTGCEVDACATDNGGCDVLRLCESDNAQATCGACIGGYKEDGEGGCEVDACATDNGGCQANRICESEAGVATCGECEFGYDDEEEDGCIRNACTLARTDTYEPDAFITAPVSATLTATKTTWHRSLSANDTDYFFFSVAEGCQFDAEWTHDGVTGSATFNVWSPQYGAGTKHAQGSFTEPGAAMVSAEVAQFPMGYNFIISAGDLCASYSLTAWQTCPTQ